jgi:MFS transporter, ACS family, hexuronate transporter
MKIHIGKYRWLIVVLLLFATTINYMDRQVIAYLKVYYCSPDGFNWTDTDYATLVSVFILFYAFVCIFMGRFIDKVGIKLGLAFSLVVWSLFGILNAFVGSALFLHLIVRSIFGLGEAGNYPASNRAIAEWFPKKERALAFSIFNSGSNIGAMISTLFVPFCLGFFTGKNQFLGLGGWQWTFILTGMIGFLWLIFWFKYYNSPLYLKNKGIVGEAEYAYIHSDEEPSEENIKSVVKTENKDLTWSRLLKYKQTWAFFWAKFMTDGIWWFYLFWLPDYLIKQFGMTSDQAKWPSFIVLGISIVGSLYGGSAPMSLINKGMQVYKARMRVMLIFALIPILVITTQYFGNKDIFGSNALIYSIILISLGAAAHQAWSANLFTTVSDMFPKKAIGSVTGIGAMSGGIGGLIIQQLSGRLNDFFRAKGIAESWVQAKMHALEPAVIKIKALTLPVIDGKNITNIKSLCDLPQGTVNKIIHAIGQSDFNALVAIQKSTIQPQLSHAYMIMFIICGLAYISSWLLMKWLVPRHKTIEDL